jgi:hypothetical protein
VADQAKKNEFLQLTREIPSNSLVNFDIYTEREDSEDSEDWVGAEQHPMAARQQHDPDLNGGSFCTRIGILM